MITLGLILLLLSYFVIHSSLMTGLGWVLLIAGVILNLVPINGTRRRYY